MIEDEATYVTEETTQFSGPGGRDTGTVGGFQGGSPTPETDPQVDALDTPAFKVPVPPPQAHEGTITDVVATTFDSGTKAITIKLASINNSSLAEQDFTIFHPLAFAADIYVTPEQVSDEVPEGRKMSARLQLGQAKATIDNLRRIARDQGRTGNDAATAIFGEARRPTNYDEYVTVLKILLTGVSIVFTRAADRKPSDLQFATMLRVRRIYGPEAAEPTRAAKLFKGHVLAWAEDQT